MMLVLMARTGREWSRGERVVVAACLVALVELWTCAPAAAEGDKPAPPPTIFELTKPQVPSAIKGMSDSVRESLLTPPPPPVQEWVLQPDGSMKNTRTGVTIALRNVCAPGDMQHEAALAAFKRSQARKNH
jgi:hypothetical protein